MARKIVVLDSHQIDDNRISKHILFIKERYGVFRINLNFYSERRPSADGDEDVHIINFVPTRNPYLNGLLFTLRTSLGGFVTRLERALLTDFVITGDDVIFHIHDPYLLGLAWKISKRFPNSRIVYDRHEYYETWKNRFGFSAPGFLEKLYGKRVTEVIFVSSKIENLPKVFLGKKVSVIPNYPVSKKFDESPVLNKIEAMDSNDRIKMVYFGVLNLNFDRDIALMFQLARSMMRLDSRFSLTVAGRVYDQEINNIIKDMTDEFGERMSYLGEITNLEVIRNTQLAHLGFFLLKPDSTMWSEERPVSPNKIYEYLLSGTIPIVRAEIDDREIIDECSLIFGKDSLDQDILDSILELCNDKERMKGMMQQCYHFGLKYSWENVAKRYLDSYERIFEIMN